MSILGKERLIFMPISEKKKASNAKWDLANMATLGCKVKKEEATAFKDYAAQRGKTSNTMLKEYVISCISANEASGVIEREE